MKLQISLSVSCAIGLVQILMITPCLCIQSISCQLVVSKTALPNVAASASFHNSDENPTIPEAGKEKKRKIISFRFVEGFFKNILNIFVTDPDTLRIIAKACSWITWTFVLLSAFGTFGFDTKPLLSLLSVVGLTIGFAAKDILTNIFKGFYVLLTKPFKRGWIISVNGFRGKVISIDSRFVKLSSLIDKSEILVPLSMIYDTAIVVERKMDM
jgi:small-conductance mechanosensitive channel